MASAKYAGPTSASSSPSSASVGWADDPASAARRFIASRSASRSVANAAAATSAPCTRAWTRTGARERRSVYRYPASSSTWKKARHTIHTEAELPKYGSTSRPANGCT